MADSKKKSNPADDLMASLLKEVGMSAEDLENSADSESSSENTSSSDVLNLNVSDDESHSVAGASFLSSQGSDFTTKTENEYSEKTHDEYNIKASGDYNAAPVSDYKSEAPSDYSDEGTQKLEMSLFNDSESAPTSEPSLFASSSSEEKQSSSDDSEPLVIPPAEAPVKQAVSSGADSLFGPETPKDSAGATQAIGKTNLTATERTIPIAGLAQSSQQSAGEESSSDKTVAVTGFQLREPESHEDKVKVSIGHNRGMHSPNYAAWGGAEPTLGHAENLRFAQEKILELERENEKLRYQNEELMSASEIIKERSDLLNAQINEYKNDKENLEESFKNEIALLKGQIQKKDAELQKAMIKVDDLDSRLRFDMKKIRIRERELENRLELIRAEKNALTKAKDEQILDLRRKMDVLQMEVESYRQKCVELNKSLETNQESFKRTTRALRLAMANLELQEENKTSLKKVD